MTFKRPYSAGLAALAVGMFAATAAYAEPTVNKGDNAWLRTSTGMGLLMPLRGLRLTTRQQGRQRLDADIDGAGAVDDHSRPGAVLWRSRPFQEHALGPDAGVLHRLHRHPALGAVWLQPRLHRWFRLHRRLLQGLPDGRDAGYEG